MVVPFLPDGGLRDLYDRPIGFHAGRESPFSVWGQVGLDWLQTVLKVAVTGLALAVAFVPRRQDTVQVAALGAAVLVASSSRRRTGSISTWCGSHRWCWWRSSPRNATRRSRRGREPGHG